MRYIEKDMIFPKRGYGRLLATGDWHIGNSACHEEGIRNFLKRAARHTWIHHGDMYEGILAGDKRHDANEHKKTLMECQQFVEKLFKKSVVDTCVGVIVGNHDMSASRVVGDIISDLCANTGVQYLSGTCFIDYGCPDGTMRQFAAHGSGSTGGKAGEPERKKTNKQVKLRDILKPFHADVCGMGHIHQGIVTPPVDEERLTVVDGKVKRGPINVRHGWYYSTPSMFKTYPEGNDYPNYAEMKLYSATDLGWIELIVERDGTIKAIEEYYESGELKNVNERTVIS